MSTAAAGLAELVATDWYVQPDIEMAQNTAAEILLITGFPGRISMTLARELLSIVCRPRSEF